ncbi:MAG: polysaccharide biosynthesis protein, partial [bacterium]|nr:polysaccharide biosynthesis protein [bacterium]
RNHRDRYRPVAFADIDPRLRGRRIHGIKVAGGLEDIERLTGDYGVQMVVIALPKPTPALLRGLVDHCRRARLEFKIVPALGQVMGGHVHVSQMRPVEIEDLLGRPPVRLASEAGAAGLRGRRVLVTGAGGSIGAELCRQVLEHTPARLVMLGRGENSLWDIQQELAPQAAALGVGLDVVIGNIRDESLIRLLLARLRPEVVFHAAAHKHVHFMEAQPAEAVKNNVLGTRVVAEAALAAGVERFILISTDKAVRPRGVMGASKRIAEMLVSTLNARGGTRFIAVRFGNVLGSRGSIIPLFRRQIAEGGPVTVTHPEATRYFMTIPEAVRLVIEAGVRGEGAEVFLPDMG